MGGFRIRAAREEDVEQLIETAMCAYPGGGGYDRYKRSITQNSLGGLGNIRVLEKDGRIVGQGALYPFEVWLGGRAVPAGGIASVAVPPEARRQGIARALIDELHREADARKGAFTLLYPFREAFYASLGYRSVGPLLTLRVASDAVAGLAKPSGTADLTPVPIDGGLLGQARELYEEVARSAAGRLARTETHWLSLFSRESRHWMGVVAPGGRLHGYVSFSYDMPVLHGRQTLVVHELMARDARARSALLAALGSQRDQVDDIEMNVPFEDPLSFAFLDAPGSRRGRASIQHPLGVLGAGPMVRLADVGRALAARGYAEEGELTFIIDDDGKTPVHLTVRDGIAEVGTTSSGFELELSRATLGSIVAAGMRPSTAAALGLLRGEPAAVRVADYLFSGPRFQCLDPF